MIDFSTVIKYEEFVYILETVTLYLKAKQARILNIDVTDEWHSM